MRIPFDHDIRIQRQPDRTVGRRFAVAELEYLFLPLLVLRRTGSLQPAIDTDGLHAVMLAEFPAQVVAGHEAAEARMERFDVVILQVDFDEGFPVVVALMHFDMVQHVTGKIEIPGDAKLVHDLADIDAVLFEQQTVPVLQRRLRQIQARCFAKVRRTKQFAFQIVRPAMQRAHDAVGMAAPIEHLCLPMPADVRQQFNAVCVTHQHAAFVFPRKRREIADIRHLQFMADIARTMLKQLPVFLL